MKNFNLVEKRGCKEVAFVYLLKSKNDDSYIECVESLDPPFSSSEKWVITLSSQKGCPVGCVFCDASYYFKGNLTTEEILDQLNLILDNHKYDDYLKSKKIKLHLARMGEPSFNDNAVDFLCVVGNEHKTINFVPSIATVAPKGREKWFEKLKETKDKFFSNGNFQLQFSINTTDEAQRDILMPAKKMSFNEISTFADFWLKENDRLITLNFALSKDAIFEARKIEKIFSPEKFLIKITPLNPGQKQLRNVSLLDYDGVVPSKLDKEIEFLKKCGFKVIISIGSRKEIEIGSNCGQIAFSVYQKTKENLKNVV
ncbi:MAG: radical SAM protein [Acidobacteria bacterium]|nr:radical SAM protein [Acidobacteriota bacterium]